MIPSRISTQTVVWVAIVIGLVLLPFIEKFIRLYIALPLKHRGDPSPVLPQLVDIDPSNFPPYVAQQFTNIARAFAALGFTAGSHLRMRTMRQGTETYTSAWLAPQQGTSAHFTFVRATTDVVTHDNTSISFCTQFDDGSAIFTGNFDRSIFVPDPKVDIVRWRGMTDPFVLHEFHRKRVERDAGNRGKIVPTPEQTKEHTIYWNDRAMKRQVEAGYYWLDERENVYRRTTKGAFFITWKLLRPWKQLLQAKDERKLRRALRDVGMLPPEQYPVRPTNLGDHVTQPDYQRAL
jgi:hypothetical protein